MPVSKLFFVQYLDTTSDFRMYNRDEKIKDSLKHKPVDTDRLKRFGFIGAILVVLFISISSKLEWAMQTIGTDNTVVLLDDGIEVEQDGSNDLSTASSVNGTTTASETGISNELIIVTPEAGIGGVVSSDSSQFESSGLIRWSDSRYYYMQLHTYTSTRRAQLARFKKEKLEAMGYTVTAQPRVGNSGIILWMIGVNRYSTYMNASEAIGKMVDPLTSFTIQKGGDIDMRVFAGTGDVNEGNRRYTLVLGSHENAELQRFRAEQWRTIGFDAIRLEENFPFRLFTGMYHLRTEAEYLAEIVTTKSGERVTFIRLE